MLVKTRSLRRRLRFDVIVACVDQLCGGVLLQCGVDAVTARVLAGLVHQYVVYLVQVHRHRAHVTAEAQLDVAQPAHRLAFIDLGILPVLKWVRIEAEIFPLGRMIGSPRDGAPCFSGFDKNTNIFGILAFRRDLLFQVNAVSLDVAKEHRYATGDVINRLTTQPTHGLRAVAFAVAERQKAEILPDT